MPELKTRNVFIDTEVFVGSHFNFKGPSLSALAAHGANGDVKVFLTDVTVEEVKANIRVAVQASARAHQSFTAKARILENSASADIKAALVKLDSSVVESELISQFQVFLNDSKAVILKAAEMKAGPVLDAYFNQEPPFGKGKKKNEFPDAFTIAALHQWCQQNKEALYVISQDSDMQSACTDAGPLHILEQLGSFLDALASDLEEESTDFVRTQIVQRKDEVIKYVTKNFPDRGFVITDVADFDSSVEDVQVTEVGLADDDFDIISVDCDSAEITAVLHLSYQAELVYGNEDTAAWDSEDGRYYFFETVRKTVQRDNDFQVDITVTFDDHHPESFAIEGIHLDAPSTIELDAEENGWPYK